MRIAMIGTGYVGLVSGACFADFGHDVICVDKDEKKIAALHRGEIPIYEPGLDELVATNVKAKRLEFTTDLSKPVADADAVFIAVGTPSRRGDGHADLSYVYAAAKEIAQSLSGFTVVVTKSTVPVGTGDEVERIIGETNPKADVVVASNPEFLREGAAIRDFKFPDRIVVGTSDERGRKVMSDIYRPLSLNQAPLMFTERRTAEMIKYAANAFLATKITFINEIADLSEKVGANVQEVARGIGLDNRIGTKFLHAGPGFGRLLLPKGHQGADQDRAGLRRELAHRRIRARGQREPQAGDGAKSEPGARRFAARQDHRRARAHLQARHRRHARRAVDPAGDRPDRHGREGEGLRSRRHGAGED
ncbi:nucleotide sugar dehydrogenase [Bradyrhizobium sp. GM5.1]